MERWFNVELACDRSTSRCSNDPTKSNRRLKIFLIYEGKQCTDSEKTDFQL